VRGQLVLELGLALNASRTAIAAGEVYTFMTPHVHPARPEDADDFLRLILASDKAFLPSLFGDDYERIIRGIFVSGEGLFGYPNVRTVEVENRVAGMLLAYTYEQMVTAMAQWETDEEQSPAADGPESDIEPPRTPRAPSTRRTSRSGLSLCLGDLVVKILHRFRGRPEPATRSGWVNPGEYYLANMAVYPEFRRQGLGRLLLADAEARARQQGCNRLALDVEAENRDAVRLYEHTGFVREEHDLRLMGRFQFARYSRPVGGAEVAAQ